MPILKIAVYEHICGGGYAEHTLPANILAEGYGMLRCISADFKEAGHEVTVFLDQRIAELNPPLAVDFIVPISFKNESAMFLSEVAKINDASLVIAPETGGTLQKLVEIVEKTEKTSLNCTSQAINHVSDKNVLYGQLQKTGISTPQTFVMDVTEPLDFIRRTIEEGFLYPVVFKPTDGTSCGGVSLVCRPVEIEKALNKIKIQSSSGKFIVQQYILGESASVSVLCNTKKAQAVSLNRQSVNLNAPSVDSCYIGGAVPIDHPLKQEAFVVAEKTVKLFSGLRGYVGVDVILTHDKVYVLDLNPRLTTSYIGLKEVAERNLGQEIIDAIVHMQLSEFRVRGVTCFGKLQTTKPSLKAFHKVANAAVVVSPPFPFTDPAFTLLRGTGSTAQEAARRLEEAKKSLCSILC